MKKIKNQARYEVFTPKPLTLTFFLMMCGIPSYGAERVNVIVQN